jgi:hypothetical protein
MAFPSGSSCCSFKSDLIEHPLALSAVSHWAGLYIDLK